MTSEEVKTAEMIVALVRQYIAHHMDQCPYCEQGPNAYNEANRAVNAALADVSRMIAYVKEKDGG